MDRAYEAEARNYAAAGIVPLPVDPDRKKPMVGNPGRFGRRGALQIAGKPKFANANLGFWCGRHNRLTVVDVDSPTDAERQHAIDTYGDSPVIVETPSGGRHVWYRYAGERRLIRPDKSHPIDVLGSGLCLAPPSKKPDGRVYRFERGSLADLANLPTIRRGALPGATSGAAGAILEDCPPDGISTTPGRQGMAVPSGAIVGQRNDTLFRRALALARSAEDHDTLLDQVRRTNAELQSPLPDDEVQRAVGSAWRYRAEGRLMVSGMESVILLPGATIGRLLTAGETDAAVLLMLLRKHHYGLRETFAVSPEAMEQAQLIGSWNKRRYRNAIRRLRDAGELVQVTQGGKGRHTPSLYGFPLLGG